MRWASAFLIASLVAMPAWADERVDHLEPQPSAIDQHTQDNLAKIVHTVFREAWGRDIKVRMYTTSGLSETADMIALREDQGTYRVVYLSTPNTLLWYTHMGRKMRRPSQPPLKPDDYHDLKPKRCEIEAAQSLGRSIVDVWHAVLMRTHYYRNAHFPPPDGGWAYFSMDTAAGMRSGMVSAAVEPGSQAGLLWQVASDMQWLCTERTRKWRDRLTNDVAALEAKLKR